jgi:hypothetical protein
MEKQFKLLSHFDNKYKGVVLNEFLYFIRGGELEAEVLLNRIKKRIDQHKQWRTLENTNEQWDKYFRNTNERQQLEDFYEALAYAEEWEKKPREEKEKIKQEQAKYFIKQSMKGKPATEKQIIFLKSKGLKEIPNDRYECSELIDSIINL